MGDRLQQWRPSRLLSTERKALSKVELSEFKEVCKKGFSLLGFVVCFDAFPVERFVDDSDV